ncbi:MAG: flagellar biosynthetic protein FliP [Gammaproteobacteria bacterium]|nr:MAG: flagellar biosynthetic protein FliP [Gammaproteobacteria bacterium]
MVRRSTQCILSVLALCALPSYGAEIPLLNIQNTPSGQEVSVSLQVLILMTLLTLLPAILMTMTSFTRIVVVLAILRQALGMQQTPSNQILIGLALFLSLFVMAPVFEQIHVQAVQPYMEDQIGPKEALDKALAPMKRFMLAQTRQEELDLFQSLANEDSGEKANPSLLVLLPAFVTSELKTAFQIGFILFIPFLIIDLVIASILMAMGMMMLSPMMISLPFKIMLFVLVDGWALILGALANSFVGPS